MLSLNFDPFPELTTERLILRRFSMDDVEAVFRLRTDPEVLKYLLREPAQSMEEVYAFLKNYFLELEAGKSIFWAMELKEQPGFIGNIGYRITKPEHSRVETGYSMFPEYFGKGLMQEAFQKILEYGFRNINFHTVEAVIDPTNDASRKLLERNGFVQEGYYKEDYFFRGAFYDSAFYSRINPYHTHAEQS